MVLCDPNGCVPCCDFCIHARHEEWDDATGHHIGGPEACLIHEDEHHQELADSCSYCDDFHCFRAAEKYFSEE